MAHSSSQPSDCNYKSIKVLLAGRGASLGQRDARLRDRHVAHSSGQPGDCNYKSIKVVLAGRGAFLGQRDTRLRDVSPAASAQRDGDYLKGHELDLVVEGAEREESLRMQVCISWYICIDYC